MSHDDLPPNAEPTSDSLRETSPPEAPSAPAPRRRRARAAQADAAPPAEPTTTEKPARATRSRRKNVPAGETPAARPAEAAPAQETPAAPAPEAATKPPRRRRSAKAASAETPAESQESVPAASAEAAPSSESAPAIAPEETPAAGKTTRRRGGRARKTVAPAADTAALETPATEETAPAPAESAAPEEAATEERAGRRRRGGRTRRTASPEATTTEAAEVAAPTETPEASPVAEAEGDTTETARRGRRSRRERAPRKGRGRGTVETEEAAAEAETLSLRSPGPEPVAEEKIDRTVGAHLVWRHGVAEIHIDSVAYPPILFFGNLEGGDSQRVLSEVRRAAHAGVHLHSTLIELPCPLDNPGVALEEMDHRLKAILGADPEGFVMPRIVFVPARGWKREYPTEIATYADGATGDPSITSERFWQEAELSLVTLIDHLRGQEWGRRVFGFHLERGEWFQPADQGYDRSTANRDAFRDWLREKYRNSLVALRAAWYDGEVQFHTAEIPPLITKPNPQNAFYETRRQRRYIDFNEFTSESTARRLIALARVIKKATGNQALVSVCYGYTFEFGHPFSGHLALSMLQSAQAVNLVCGPPSYRDRKPGGAASLPAPVDSLALHGKLWLSEDDTKTYLAPAQQDPEDYNPRLGDRFATEQAHVRAMGRALATLTGVGWMDLWGEGWLDDEGVWERLSAFTARYRAFQRHHERVRTPDVVVLIDEKSLLHVQRGETFFRKLTNGLRDTLQRAGVSYGLYLQSDLLAKDFPTGASLYLFLTPYRLTAEQRAAIKEKLQRDHKTLAWLYAPGTCEEYPGVSGAMEETAHGVVGFTLRQQEWNSEVGSRIIEPYHVVTERLPNREIGTRERLNPSFYVDDRDVTALAEYQGSGLTSLAVKNFGTWKSVFVGDPALPLELLRGICRYAGVPTWMTRGDDILFIGNGWVTLHAAKDGPRTLFLPHTTGLYDMTEARLIADEASEYTFTLRAGTTRVFYIGATEQFVRMGLPNVTLPGADRARIVLEKPQETRREAATLPARVRADLETLEAVLTMEVPDLENGAEAALDGVLEAHAPDTEAAEPSEAGEETPGEVVADGRRRRRRGGRGRWRRRTGSLSEGGEGVSGPSDDSGGSAPPPAET